MALTPAIGIRCSLASPSECSSEKGDQSLDFFALCALKLRTNFVNGELAKPRDFIRSQDDLLRTFTDALDEQVGPQRQQICCSLVYCGLLLLQERPFFSRSVKETGRKPGISRWSLCMVSLYFAQWEGATPIIASLCRRPVCQTLSKALSFLKSMNTAVGCFPRFEAVIQVSARYMSCMTVEWWGRKPELVFS